MSKLHQIHCALPCILSNKPAHKVNRMNSSRDAKNRQADRDSLLYIYIVIYEVKLVNLGIFKQPCVASRSVYC